MSIEKKKVILEEYLDNVLAEISLKNLTAAEADDYSEDIIDQIEDKYNLFGEVGKPKIAEKYMIEKISNVFDVLLARGLDVNSDSDKNALSSCIWIENEPIAVILAKKFLEYGANPNLKLTCDGGESLHDYMNACIGYNRFDDDGFMKIWLLLIAYGGCYEDGETCLEMLNGYSAEIFKNIYVFCLRRERDANGSPVMYFYNISTNEDVALY
ncbi:hypothetical protein [Phascolarctobacterium succinatutens]|uniref:hypothetical protein n=1 Tax=Phascolarctobacterium succinatutens TaxID=626940 RepID=UPI0026E9DDA5|nr:hypothetical protein [Phascolarctobacterium succinatutens]